MELTFRRLRWLNVGVGLFQLLTGLALFGISSYDGATSLPWWVGQRAGLQAVWRTHHPLVPARRAPS